MWYTGWLRSHLALDATCVLRSIVWLFRHPVRAGLYEEDIWTVICHYRLNFLWYLNNFWNSVIITRGFSWRCVDRPWPWRLVAGLSPRSLGFDPRVFQIGCVVDRVAMEQVPVPVRRLSPAPHFPKRRVVIAILRCVTAQESAEVWHCLQTWCAL
jgi:hypothetical protein